MQSGNCTFTIASKPCQDAARSKRSIQTNVPFTMAIQMDVDYTEFSFQDLENLISKRIGMFLIIVNLARVL